MNHREFLQSLTPEQRKQLTEKSDAKGLIHLAQHWGLILTGVSLIIAEVPMWPLLMLPLGILLVFQFTLLHETIHFTPFNTRWINMLVAKLCGYLLFLPPVWFRYFHLEHHRQTHVPDKDPELASPKPKTKREYWVYLSGLPLWTSAFKTLWINASGKCADAYVPRDGRLLVQKEARQMIGVYIVLLVASLLLDSAELLYIWLIPIVFGQPFLRIYLLAEHTGCPHSDNMFVNTRTTYTSSVIRWLAWNMPFHAEHHSYAAVPFYRLPDLHKMIAEHLQSTEQGYQAFESRFRKGLLRKGLG